MSNVRTAIVVIAALRGSPPDLPRRFDASAALFDWFSIADWSIRAGAGANIEMETEGRSTELLVMGRKDGKIEQEMRAHAVRYNRKLAMKLTHHARYYFEAQARAGLINGKSVRKADAMVGNFDAEVPLDFPR